MSNSTAPADWRVRVRMYCHGLGDCFLVSFREEGKDAGHVLIDCGVLNPGFSKLRAAVADVERVTGGKVDLLIVTHEHWDHVSGFTQARDLLDRIDFAAVWLAWTENLADPEAATLHDRYDEIQNTLRLVCSQPGNPAAAATQELLAFSESTREALDYVQARMKNCGKGHFCVPGETLKPLRTGVRFHVLAPPTGKLLYKDKPRPGSHETYEIALASATLDNPDFRNTWDYPFEACLKMPRSPLIPGSKLDQVAARYDAPAEVWRRIDNDWLAGSAELALQMDKFTNNTSLAVAIELDGGEVLLFPGDAQVGNWQSWHQVKWQDPTVDTNQLLARTVFYKAGHHASHNGTLRDGGLELMNNLRQVMIPTDEAFALTRNPKGTWQMPAKALYAALDEKSRHSVIRSDRAGEATYVDWLLS